MSVIVFNKLTGKYLRKHSGSYRHQWNRMRYKDSVSKELDKKFGPAPPWHTDAEANHEYHKKVSMFLQDSIFNASPEDARVYVTKGSATSSVGVFDRASTDGHVYKLPDHLEIHEIKEVSVCVMRPDGSSNCDDGEVK